MLEESRPDTTILVRHHPLLLLRRGWRPGLVMLLAALATVMAATAGDAGGWRFYDPLLRALLVAFLGGGAWAAWVWVGWSAEVLWLTERRLIAVAGIPRWSAERRELRIERIQSVEIDQRGLLMRWCGCGDLVVDIAGAGPLRFAAARDVAALRERIGARLRERDRAREVVDEAEVRSAVRQLLNPDEPALPLMEGGGRRAEGGQGGAGGAGDGGAPPAPRGGKDRHGRQQGWWGRLRPLSALRPPPSARGQVWRRHPWFLARGVAGPVALAVAALALPFLLDALALAALEPFTRGIAIFALVAAGCWFAWLWADWRNDHYVVTPDRLIEIEQLPLGLRKQVSEAALDRVQDIRYRVPHPLAWALDYGDVEVHTAGETTPFVFRGIARPRQLAATIDEHVTAFRLDQEAARHRHLRDEFAQWLLAYEQVHAERGMRNAES